MTLIFKSGISGKPTLQHETNDHFHEQINKNILPNSITRWWRNIELKENYFAHNLSKNQLTVTIPLKLVTSTFAPISSWENFSNNLLTNGKLAKIWKYLFNAKLVKAVPNFRVTALEEQYSKKKFPISCSLHFGNLRFFC